jgi:hypothetical protein
VPRVAEVLGLDEIVRAHELAQSGSLSGKVVVTPATPGSRVEA